MGEALEYRRVHASDPLAGVELLIFDKNPDGPGFDRGVEPHLARVRGART